MDHQQLWKSLGEINYPESHQQSLEDTLGLQVFSAYAECTPESAKVGLVDQSKVAMDKAYDAVFEGGDIVDDYYRDNLHLVDIEKMKRVAESRLQSVRDHKFIGIRQYAQFKTDMLEAEKERNIHI
jgi:hypothetical protein